MGRMSEKRSVFTGVVMGIRALEDRVPAVAAARERVSGATHYAIGLRTNPTEEFFSDAGEPSGTAGRPLLELLRQWDVQGGILIVARHFGGVKLGRPGLLRAYREAGAAALTASRLEEPELMLPFSLTLPYTHYETFRHQFPGVADDPDTVSFSDEVVIESRIAAKEGPHLQAFTAAHGGAHRLAMGDPFFSTASSPSVLTWPHGVP